MKKLKYPGLIIFFLIMFSVVLNGCFDNNQFEPDKYTKYGKIYMGQARDNPANRLLLMVDTTQTVIFNAAYAGVDEPSSNIPVNFSVKPALVDSFNAENATSYPILPKESYKLNQTKTTIPAGERRSNKLKINLMTEGHIKAGGTQYLLPVTMKVKNGKIPIIKKWQITYFLIEGKYTKIYMSQAEINPVEHKLDPAIDTAQTLNYSADYRGVEGVAASKTPGNDISVNFSVKPALVDSFNAKNSTSYPILPKESYKMGQTNAIIPAGKLSSGKFKINLKYKDNIVDIGEKYLLPLRLNLAEKTGGARLDEQLQTIFFLIDVSYHNLDRSEWTVLTSNHHQPGFEVSNMFDGKLGTTWNSGYKIPDATPARPAPPHYISVDMGKPYTIHGFQIFGNQKQHLGQNPKKITFQFSDDGKNWRDEEEVTTPFTLTIAKGKVYLKQAVKARYFKIIIPKGGMVKSFRKVSTIAELYAF